MTSKVYRSAQGKMVDLGTIMLQNEHVRAVGNMKVNARGDKLDSLNHVVETRTESIQRHNDQTSTNVNNSPVHTSSKRARQSKAVAPETQVQSRGMVQQREPEPVLDIQPVTAPAPQQVVVAPRQVAPTPPANPTPASAQPKMDLNNPARPAKSPVSSAPSAPAQGGGLASAIARSREIKQDLDRTRRQKAQDSGLRKI